MKNIIGNKKFIGWNILFTFIMILLFVFVSPGQTEVINSVADNEKTLIYFQSQNTNSQIPYKLNQNLENLHIKHPIIAENDTEVLYRIPSFTLKEDKNISTNIFIINNVLHEKLIEDNNIEGNTSYYFGLNELGNIEYMKWITDNIGHNEINPNNSQKISQAPGVILPDVNEKCNCQFPQESGLSLIIPVDLLSKEFIEDLNVDHWFLRLSYDLAKSELSKMREISAVANEIESIKSSIVHELSLVDIDYSIQIFESVFLFKIFSRYNHITNDISWYREKLIVPILFLQILITFALSQTFFSEDSLRLMRLFKVRGLCESDIKLNLVLHNAIVPVIINLLSLFIIYLIGYFQFNIFLSLAFIIIGWSISYSPIMIYQIVRLRLTEELTNPDTNNDKKMNRSFIFIVMFVLLSLLLSGGSFWIFVRNIELLNFFKIFLLFLFISIPTILLDFLFRSEKSDQSIYSKMIIRSIRAERYLLLLIIFVIIFNSTQITNHQVFIANQKYQQQVAGDNVGNFELSSENNTLLEELNLDVIDSIGAWTLVYQYMISFSLSDEVSIPLYVTNGEAYSDFTTVKNNPGRLEFANEQGKIWIPEPYYAELSDQATVRLQIDSNELQIPSNDIVLLDEDLGLSNINRASMYMTLQSLDIHGLNISNFESGDTPIINSIQIEANDVTLNELKIEIFEKLNLNEDIVRIDHLKDTPDTDLSRLTSVNYMTYILITIFGIVGLHDRTFLFESFKIIKNRYNDKEELNKAILKRLFYYNLLFITALLVGVGWGLFLFNLDNPFNGYRYLRNINAFDSILYLPIFTSVLYLAVSFGFSYITTKKV